MIMLGRFFILPNIEFFEKIFSWFGDGGNQSLSDNGLSSFVS